MSMPSVFTSLAGASQDTLEQVLAEREFRRVQAEQAAEAQRKMQMDAMNMQLRLRGDQRAEAGESRADAAARLARERFEADQARAGDETAAKSREQATRLGVIDMVRQGRGQLDPLDSRLMAAEGGLPITTFDVPESEESRLRFKRKELEMREEVKAKHAKPKATKVAKENAAAPPAFIQMIQNRMGQKWDGRDYTTIDSAIKDIENNWAAFKKSYPGLEVNAVRTALQNLYGKRPASARQSAFSVDDPE